ncbi:MAG: hypothetical protein OEZ06_30745 [Myxococcales bacterium]|nr:hypothetical protein [Myxococcales bacterium]
MIPWKLLEEAPVPGGEDSLRLYQRGQEFSIRVGRQELMNSRVYGSEDALAELACAPLADSKHPEVLIGGLGMGYTLAAALRVLGPGARLVQSELVAAVVRWNRGPLGEVAGRPLQDARVVVVERDVGELMVAADGRYDAILLDVDNGPEGLSRAQNDRLYASAGLSDARRALKPGGAVWFWSAGDRPGFASRLRRARFEVREHRVRARGRRRGAHHLLWEARRPPRDQSSPSRRMSSSSKLK